MIDMTNDDTNTDDLRAETAGDAPELAEHDRYAALEEEVARLKNEVLYAQADTQNVRRRLEKDKADATAYAATSFARDMLSVADNMSRALSVIPDEMRGDERLKGLLVGIEATGRELESVLKRHGVVKIESMGEKLDPNKHQAMIEMPSDKAPGTVIQEMQAGYMLRDRLLRPAMVGVARAPDGAGAA
jgi:molecular chaperone GrpE